MQPQPRVRFSELSMHASIHSEAPETPGIPHAVVLRFIRALGDEFILPPSSRGLRGISYPGWAECASARLDTNNGCQDHTTSPHASMPLVLHAALDRSRVAPPCDLMRTRHRRVHRIPPHVSVTIGQLYHTVLKNRSKIFLRERAGQELANAARRG